MGLVGCFSFYPARISGLWGRGAVVTQSEDIANKIRMIRDHARPRSTTTTWKATTAASMPSRQGVAHQAEEACELE